MEKRAIFHTQIINNSGHQSSQNLLITFDIKVLLYNLIFLCFRCIWRREFVVFPEWQVARGKTGAAINVRNASGQVGSYLFQCLFGKRAFDPRPHTSGNTKSPLCIRSSWELSVELGSNCALTCSFLIVQLNCFLDILIWSWSFFYGHNV